MKHEAIKDDFKEKYIKLAAERLSFLKMSLEEQADYMRYQIEMIDVREEFQTQYIKGKSEGKAEGKAEGMEQRTIEMAKAMLLQGISLDVIANISGLPQETLAKLASKK